jgi:hypothetical protein
VFTPEDTPMRTYRLRDAVRRHPEISGSTLTIRDLQARFRPATRNAVKMLLIEMGPFRPDEDAFRFRNNFPITADQVPDFLEFVRDEVLEAVAEAGLIPYRSFLSALKIPVPVLPDISLPDVIVQAVIDRVAVELLARLVKACRDPLGGSFGRCGGMAFAGYDFYLQGWRVDGFGSVPPTEGELSDYIYQRLLDSLRLNVRTFLEWVMVLHVMPAVDEIATATLLATAGSFAAPIGPVIGAFIGSRIDIFDLGGADALLQRTKDEWTILKRRLDHEAAVPLGVIYGDEAMLWEQHQVLAIGYTDGGTGTATLEVWDNNDGNTAQTLGLDFRGEELNVSVPGGALSGRQVRGIFPEEYSRRRPPQTLKVP